MIYIEDFDSNLLKLDKKSHRSIDIYYIEYIAVKDSDYVKINSLNPLFLFTDNVEGYIEEKNRSKYLTFASTDKNKEVLIKYVELWDEIKHLIKTINGGEAGEQGKVFMKIKLNSDDNLPLNKY